MVFEKLQFLSKDPGRQEALRLGGERDKRDGSGRRYPAALPLPPSLDLLLLTELSA